MFDNHRLAGPNLGLDLNPSFQILPSDRLLVLGTSFASNMRASLAARGFPILGEQLGNKYNLFSILQSLHWCLEDGFQESFLVRLANGSWFDGHLHPFRDHVSADAALGAQLMVLAQLAAAIQDCDVLMLAPGLTEVWRDEREQIWLNGTPPINRIPEFEHRFSVHRTSHAENLEALDGILDLVRAINPAARIICMVSPASMRATFFGEDVLLASMHCKSTLRSVIGEAMDRAGVSGVGSVDYYPCYELVLLQHQPGMTRQVPKSVMNQVVVKTFLDTYVSGSSQIALRGEKRRKPESSGGQNLLTGRACGYTNSQGTD